MPKTRIVLELDSELLEQLEAADALTYNHLDERTRMVVEQTIAERLRVTAEYDLTGAPLFLDAEQHRRLRALSGLAAIGGTEALLERLEAMTRIRIGEGDDGVLRLPSKVQERLASRAKLDGKTAGQLGCDYALQGIKERVGL